MKYLLDTDHLSVLQAIDFNRDRVIALDLVKSITYGTLRERAILSIYTSRLIDSIGSKRRIEL